MAYWLPKAHCHIPMIHNQFVHYITQSQSILMILLYHCFLNRSTPAIKAGAGQPAGFCRNRSFPDCQTGKKLVYYGGKCISQPSHRQKGDMICSKNHTNGCCPACWRQSWRSRSCRRGWPGRQARRRFPARWPPRCGWTIPRSWRSCRSAMCRSACSGRNRPGPGGPGPAGQLPGGRL